VGAIRHGRRAAGAEVVKKYVDIARLRIEAELSGELKTRPMHKPVYDPMKSGNKLTVSPWIDSKASNQKRLFDDDSRRS
jgi:adenine-specific DNA-methyltransferase